MQSPVYFWDLRATMKAPFDVRLRRLLKATGYGSHIESGDLAALKIHFGERGTTAFIHPIWIKPIVDFFRKSGAKPFLTDTNTLYVGQRGESVSHAMQAAMHGFDPAVLGAPVIIADGIKSGNERAIEYPGTNFQTFYLAGDILDADLLVTLNHFKGHELAGFGGALKNLGMGCATRKGKMQQHCGMGPKVLEEKCSACGACVNVCAPEALSLKEGERITLDAERCVGCAACFLACRHGGLVVDWKVEVNTFLERMIEYAASVMTTFAKPALHMSFLMNITPACDCTGYSDAPLCPDLGIIASMDPVALDQAGFDLVSQAMPRAGMLPESYRAGEDKFNAIHSHVQGDYAIAYAE
ncbi:MAG: DUF362 domain-containing protein, partial [Desulfovibrionales bacterium]